MMKRRREGLSLNFSLSERGCYSVLAVIANVISQFSSYESGEVIQFIRIPDAISPTPLSQQLLVSPFVQCQQLLVNPLVQSQQLLVSPLVHHCMCMELCFLVKCLCYLQVA